MKLLKLSLIGNYKGLGNQSFDFSQVSGNVLAFIGLNGSGKSQLLELIAEVFAYLERKKRNDFTVRKRLPFEVVVEYQVRPLLDRVDNYHYHLQLRKNGEVQAKILNPRGWEDVNLRNVQLPSHVVGYASGLNENLQRAFLKNALQYFDVMTTRSARRKLLAAQINEEQAEEINRHYLERYPGIFGETNGAGQLSFRERDTAIPSVIFLDYDCNALLMATLGLLPEAMLDRLFPDIPFRYPRKIVLQYDLRKAPFEEDTIQDIRQLIRVVGENLLLGMCRETSEQEFNIYELRYLAARITIDFDAPGLKDRLQEEYYNQPLQLFKKLYKIQLLGVQHWQKNDKKNLRDDAFDGNVKKPLKTKLPLSVVELKLSNGQSVIDFDDLSDGEAQLVQVLGAAHIFRGQNTLFLFDEPETHLNPSWRANFHRHLVQALDGQDLVQTMLSTHSPFLISSLHKENVFMFERTGLQTEMSSIVSETFGASFDVLIKHYFGLRSTISQTAVAEIRERLDDRSLNNETRRKWIDENVGDSMEKAYLLRRLQPDASSN